MTTRDDNPDNKAVIKYDEKYDDKGRKIWRPVYLKETPIEEIQRMSEMFSEWKNVKQD